MVSWKTQNTLIQVTSVSQKVVQEVIDSLEAASFEFINKKPEPVFDQNRGCWHVALWLPPKYVMVPKIIDESLATIPEGVEEEFYE